VAQADPHQPGGGGQLDRGRAAMTAGRRPIRRRPTDLI
jgi:hypothetical protein